MIQCRKSRLKEKILLGNQSNDCLQRQRLLPKIKLKRKYCNIMTCLIYCSVLTKSKVLHICLSQINDCLQRQRLLPKIKLKRKYCSIMTCLIYCSVLTKSKVLHICLSQINGISSNFLNEKASIGDKKTRQRSSTVIFLINSFYIQLFTCLQYVRYSSLNILCNRLLLFTLKRKYKKFLLQFKFSSATRHKEGTPDRLTASQEGGRREEEETPPVAQMRGRRGRGGQKRERREKSREEDPLALDCSESLVPRHALLNLS